ncbi:MAG: alpha-ketoglutarate-dependent dioxygenase AlkB [Myxococcales bacterium]|nr:alpha-ketoglutarate-dependent dioxygenase AlkB [Myxococcales bacterium]
MSLNHVPDERYLDDRILLFRGVFDQETQARLFLRLREETNWLDKTFRSDGKEVKLPRLTANYGERAYNYSGFLFSPEPWTPLLEELKRCAEDYSQESFNALILQFYRDGQDSVGWHSDDDPCVDPVTTLVSLSFGGTRGFHLRHKLQKEQHLEIPVHGGDLLIMRGDLQQHYVHKIPKIAQAEPRINLTFRQVMR